MAWWPPRVIHNHENVVFLGPTGVGKTHLFVAIGLYAFQSDTSVYYVLAVKFVWALRKEFMRDGLNTFLRRYARYSLMIIDEIGSFCWIAKSRIWCSSFSCTGMRSALRYSRQTSCSNGVNSSVTRKWILPFWSCIAPQNSRENKKGVLQGSKTGGNAISPIQKGEKETR